MTLKSNVLSDALRDVLSDALCDALCDALLRDISSHVLFSDALFTLSAML